MFDFLMMADNYEDRKIGRNDYPWGFISTAEVNDGEHPYETAVCHEDYRDNGDMVIVEGYDTREDAEKGHKKWIDIMTAKNLPEELIDCANAEIGQLCDAIGGKMIYKRKKAA